MREGERKSEERRQRDRERQGVREMRGKFVLTPR